MPSTRDVSGWSVVALTLVVAGCPRSATSTCAGPGVVECNCGDGRVGSRVCHADLTYERCECDGATDGGLAIDAAVPRTDAPPAVAVRATRLAAGAGSTCIVAEDGSVWCWGALTRGDLETCAPGPPVRFFTDGVDVDLWVRHACVAHRSGAVSCWGEGGMWLGDGSTVDATYHAPARVEGLDDAIDLGLETDVSCAVRRGGEAACWGHAWDPGSLGTGDGVDHATPAPLPGLDDAVSVDGGGMAFACALREGGRVSCWGPGDYNGGGGEVAAVPREIPGLVASDIALGHDHACAVREGGGVVCWGSNQFGQLGQPTSLGYAYAPRDVVEIEGATRLAAGAYHTCVLVADGSAWCWGMNPAAGSTAPPDPTPARVEGLAPSVAISAGWSHTCAIGTDGRVRCWGRNDCGEIGLGPPPEGSRRPVELVFP